MNTLTGSGKNPKLRDYEFRIIDFLVSNMDLSVGEIVLFQINKYNKIQRIADDTEVNMYCTDLFGKIRNLSKIIECRDCELLMAKIDISLKGIVINTCSIYAVNGRIFSLEFISSPSQYAHNSSLEFSVNFIDTSIKSSYP